MREKIKTLVVDDSAVVRQALSDILSNAPGIELMGAVADPIFAMHRMEKQWPDVIILDLEMPRMDGLTFLRKIMAERPTPIIICSTLAEKGAQTTIQVLSAGAVEVITKPKLGVQSFLYDQRTILIDTVKAATQANLKKLKRSTELAAVKPKLSVDAMLAPGLRHLPLTETEKVIAMGASTGGTQALEAVLRNLPTTIPGIVIVQHMPGGFTAAFAQRLNQVCNIEVKEAEDRDEVRPGRALIAPGAKHMLLKRQGRQYRVEVKDGPMINRHRPSVDVLFRSVAQNAGKNAIGVIMTGMGDDGARGLEEMHNSGADTIAQNEESCVVYGMPKEAVKRDAADHIIPLEQIAKQLIELSHERGKH